MIWGEGVLLCVVICFSSVVMKVGLMCLLCWVGLKWLCSCLVMVELSIVLVVFLMIWLRFGFLCVFVMVVSKDK